MLTPLNGQLSPLTRPRGKQPYHAKVLSISPANLIGYWQLDESGGSTALDSSGNANNGTYTGVTLAGAAWLDGTPKPTFPGASSNYVNLYSSAFNAAFNGREFSLSLWGRCPNWTDGSERRLFHFQVDGSNLIVLRKSAANNQFELIYISGGVARTSTLSTFSPASFFHVAMVVSYSGNVYRGYNAGTQIGSDQTVGAWAGALTNTNTVIGARGTSATNAWRDSVAHCAIWNTPLSAADIVRLAAA